MVTYGGVGLGRVRQAGCVGSCYSVVWQARCVMAMLGMAGQASLGTSRGVRYGLLRQAVRGVASYGIARRGALRQVMAGEVWRVNARSVGA